MKVALFIKQNIDENEDLSTLLISKINEFGFDFDQDYPDLVIVVGGDGTLLRAIHNYIDNVENISFVGIHEGSLGFACDYVASEIDQLFSDIRNGNVKVEELPLLEAELSDKTIYALNEIRIENPFHTLISDIYIDDEMLEKFRGNGLNVCSSFGSSGYNKSLGGAIIPTSLELMQLVEIAPISNKVYQTLNSPLVLSRDNEITLKGNFKDCVVGYDHLTIDANGSDVVTIRISQKTIRLVYKKCHSYYAQLCNGFIK